MRIVKELYGTTPGAQPVEAYTMDNGQLKAKILTFGAAVDELWVPDKQGRRVNVLIGHVNLADRIAHSHCQGEVAGRFCNRIAGAKFTLNGTEYRLTANVDGITCLHGAYEFNTAVWDAEVVSDTCLALRHTSPAGTHGFPGTLKTCVRYSLEGSGILMEYTAESDADTVLNLTNHAYFNLAGEGKIFNHMLRIEAEHYLPLNENLVPTGEVAPVEGTEFDFRQARPIGQSYDVNFCYPGAIEAWDPASGRRMTVETDQPAVQLYTGECLEDPFTGFCLETQHWPDAPNQPQFPSCVLKAGGKFKSYTRYRFA